MSSRVLFVCLAAALSVASTDCASHPCVGVENGQGNFCGERPDAGGDSASPSPDASILFDAGFGDGSDGGVFDTNAFKDPVIDPGAPANSPTLFAVPDQGSSGPCLGEPQLGSLFPDNWLRPRFRFAPAQSENLFEIKLVVPNQQSPLVIYTTQNAYTVTKSAWNTINVAAAGKGPIHVTIRSAVVTNGSVTSGPFMGSNGDIEVAPVDAAGSIVYWTTSNGTQLKGFRVGDETVEPVLTASQAGAPSGCVGCHTSTPDGTYVAFSVSQDANNGYPSYVRMLSLDGNATEPPFLTSTAATLLARNQSDGQILPTLSKAHWTGGDHTAITQFWQNSKYELAWTDLETTSSTQGQGWGILARNGDTNNVEAPVWSHDGTTIVYSSAPSVGGTYAFDGGLWSLPYNNRAGGTATAIPGASDAQYHYFYPAFSSDDKYLAFNRVASGGNEYNNPQSEVYVLPRAGGVPTRIVANDPPACGGVTSPGITNSWPKWSPQVQSSGGKSYYFMVFSSYRDAQANGPQLYLAPMVVDGGGTITTYPALYLWNQPEVEHNHTPAWDNFAIPVIPPN